MGLELKGGNACLMPWFRRIDYARASEARVISTFETLVFGSELLAGSLYRDPLFEGVLAKIAQNQTNGLHWKWHESMGLHPTRIRSANA